MRIAPTVPTAQTAPTAQTGAAATVVAVDVEAARPGKKPSQAQRPLGLPPVPKAGPPTVAQGTPGNAVELRAQRPGKGGVDVVHGIRPAVRQLVQAAAQRFVAEGYAGVERHIVQQERVGQTARMRAGARQLHDLDVSLNKALVGGEPGVAARLTEIDRLFVTALLSPEQSKALREEHIALKSLRETFAPLLARRAEIDAVVAGAGGGGGDLGPTLTLTYGVEQTALNALIDGSARLQATLKDAEQALLAGLLTPAAEREQGLIKNVVAAAAGGTAGIDARIAAIAHTRMVARLSPEGQETLNIEEKVLASLARELAKVQTG